MLKGFDNPRSSSLSWRETGWPLRKSSPQKAARRIIFEWIKRNFLDNCRRHSEMLPGSYNLGNWIIRMCPPVCITEIANKAESGEKATLEGILELFIEGMIFSPV